MEIKRKGRFTQKVFNKLFLTSSITIIVTVIILIVTITNYYSDIIIQKELNINTRTLERVEDYFSSKDADIDRAIRDIYIKGDMIEDISFALHNGYERYLEYRLDKFSKDKSFTPSNIDTYFNGYFSQDSDLNAISLRSLEYSSIEYLLIKNNIRWNKSIVENSTNTDQLLSQGIPNILIESLPKDRKLTNTITKTIYINNPVTLKKIGEISFFYSTERLNKMLKKHEGAPASLFIMDDGGKIIYSLNKGVPVEMINEVQHETNETKMDWEHKKYYINTIANKGDYTYVSVIPDEGWQKLSIVRGTMWVVITSLIIIAILISYSFTHNYSRRINHIVSIIRQVEKGNLNARIVESKHEDELSKIAVNINSMLTELNNYIEQFYLLNMKQQQAELKALQTQIDPHFLFNTLEAIRMVAVVEGSKTSSKMIFHLAKLFRYSLESKDMVHLYTEIEYVNQYLKLMQFKYPNKLQVQFDIPSDVEQVMVQKLILQPIIENYFVHGFKKDQSSNKLLIRAMNLSNKIEIHIEDNGKGMSEEKLTNIVHHINHEEGDEMKSIGLRNINQRLRLKYGDRFGIRLKSSENEGTTVIVSIPMQGINHV
ncbi:sensor histidine kinase [Heyndrickxia oleronia]|uniref:Sensor histidine kinase n=1 Tax=Heyndrickxia oleronia TaxID=38875 RepID=A0AAW6T074_9BACI|nr:sensor histidine kinase [Heyndrickxia oleronia]MCM3240605.1 sensor histidine kinase [Heyndrickxia oleronia]MDH5163155.1 sensor histidine kinase [Heyndrickxia oleronia]